MIGNISGREVNFYAPTGSMWHMDIGYQSYRDRWNVWIVLTEHGKQYFKHVSISGTERDSGAGLLKLFHEFMKCDENGPEGMVEVEDGGLLPYPETK
jgi:hypothetical protein